jgi:hypothetical protein
MPNDEILGRDAEVVRVKVWLEQAVEGPTALSRAGPAGIGSTGRGRLCLRRRNRIEAAAATGIGLLIAIAAGLVVGVHSDAPLTLAPRLAPDIGLAVALIVLLGAALGPLRALATPLPGEPDRSARPPPQRNGRDRTMRPGGVPGG